IRVRIRSPHPLRVASGDSFSDLHHRRATVGGVGVSLSSSALSRKPRASGAFARDGFGGKRRWNGFGSRRCHGVFVVGGMKTKTTRPRLDAEVAALELIRSLRPVVGRLDPELRKQLQRAARSVALNAAEARGRAGKDA